MSTFFSELATLGGFLLVAWFFVCGCAFLVDVVCTHWKRSRDNVVNRLAQDIFIDWARELEHSASFLSGEAGTVVPVICEYLIRNGTCRPDLMRAVVAGALAAARQKEDASLSAAEILYRRGATAEECRRPPNEKTQAADGPPEGATGGAAPDVLA